MAEGIINKDFQYGVVYNVEINIPYGGAYYKDIAVNHSLGVIPSVVVYSIEQPGFVPNTAVTSSAIGGKSLTDFAVRVWSNTEITISMNWIALK